MVTEIKAYKFVTPQSILHSESPHQEAAGKTDLQFLTESYMKERYTVQ